MNYVSYIRVSTAKQGASGLGLEAQQNAVAGYVKSQGGKVVKEFREVESGKTANRPELQSALAHAKRAGAVLVVAKLDRLSRNVAFLAALMESGVEFVCCDNPHATRFTIHILAAVAEWEREAISKRTKDAMAELKAKGVKFGSAVEGHWEGKEHLRQAGIRKGQALATANRAAKARAEYADLLPFIAEQHKAGKSYREIAALLTERGEVTRTGKQFTGVQVMRILKREGIA